ncbi:hypothetical protein [Salipaludibacillus sp. CF4.18]|uniref:hypothetical protein n=1 Tax=Salipaludibacillus sp. CF4.18 TaxID=3373081 RepID=UPI003EE6AD08
MTLSIHEIPHVVFDEIHKEIGPNTSAKLAKYILKDTVDNTSSINSYVKDILNRILFKDGEDIDLLYIKDIYRRRLQNTKKNWYKQLEEDCHKHIITPIHAERDVLKMAIENKQSDDQIKSLIGDNIEQYVYSRLQDIHDWAHNRKTRLTDYPYLDSKKHHQITKAFENDIVYIICKFLESAPKKWISHRFKDLIDNPIFSDGKKKLEGTIEYDSNQKRDIVYNEYKLSDDRIIRSFISLKEGEQIELDKMFSLDDTDSEIIEHILENRGKRFFTDKVIQFDLRPLLLRVYGHAGKKAYDLATKRLKKIGRFSIEGRTIGLDNKTKTSFLYNLFQEVKVNKDDLTDRVSAEIRLSDSLHEQFITNQTVQIYSHFIHKLENGLSKILIYAFQKERLDAFLEEREMNSHYEYTFFSDRIRFRSKKINTNLKIIESSLQELKTAKIIINHFEKSGNGFEIRLLPLMESEKKDFFNSSTINYMK